MQDFWPLYFNGTLHIAALKNREIQSLKKKCWKNTGARGLVYVIQVAFGTLFQNKTSEAQWSFLEESLKKSWPAGKSKFSRSKDFVLVRPQATV